MKEKEKEVDQFAGQFIYLGPTIRNLGLVKHRVYIGGFQVGNEPIQSKKNLGRLFVPVSKLNETQALVAKAGTPENIALQKVRKGEL